MAIQEIGSSNALKSASHDEFIESIQLDRVDLIKIDVEGFEDKVLAGGMKLISLQSPLPIFKSGSSNQIKSSMKAMPIAHCEPTHGPQVQANKIGALWIMQ